MVEFLTLKNILICVWKMNWCWSLDQHESVTQFSFLGEPSLAEKLKLMFFKLTCFPKNGVAHETLESLSVESRPMYRYRVLQRK